MFRLDADKTVEFCDGLRRRDFLHAGSLSLLGLGMPEFLQMRAEGAVRDTGKDINVIMLMLVGGPSHLDTFDMKPEAPIEIRGPFNPIKTNVPGIEISENFPRMARHADKYALLRGCYHKAACRARDGSPALPDGPPVAGGHGASPHRLGPGIPQGGQRGSALACSAAQDHRADGRQLQAGAGRGLSGQAPRPLRAQRRPFRDGFQGAGHAAARLPAGACASTGAGTGGQWSTRRSASSRLRRTRACWTPPSTRPIP